MRRYIYFSLTMLFFSTISIDFSSQFVNIDTVSEYSIWYQPFIVLGPGNLLQEMIQIIVLLSGFFMFFMGDIKEDLHGKGMYEIIRYKTKTKWLNLNLLKIMGKLVLLEVIYMMISLSVSVVMINSSFVEPKFNLLIQQMIIFYLTMLALIQMQVLLEMYFIETIANAITLILSFIVINIYSFTNINKLINNVLFVNKISIIRSGVLNNQGLEVIELLLLINTIIYVLNLLIISKKDIY